MPSFTRQQRLALALVPRLAVPLIRLLGATLRYRDVNAASPEGRVTPNGHTIPGPTLFVFWHCALLACAHRFRGLGIAILISQSFDGELIARTVERLGFIAVRGSSTRGGTLALKGMAEAYRAGRICAFTSDGPRGPAQVAKPGAVHLAQLTGASWIGAFHAQPAKAWRLRSWDRFMIPRPFTVVSFAWPAHTAADIDSVQTALDMAVQMTAKNDNPHH